jgi:hypothetical protein
MVVSTGIEPHEHVLDTAGILGLAEDEIIGGVLVRAGVFPVGRGDKVRGGVVACVTARGRADRDLLWWQSMRG